MNFFDFIQNINSFDQFITKLSNESNDIKGKYLELFTKYFFKYSTKGKAEFQKYFMLNDIPTELLKILKLPTNDIGIDGIAINKNNELVAIQVKYRKEPLISFTELSTFIASAFGVSDIITEAIVITNAKRLSSKLQNTKKVRIFNYDILNEIPKNFFKQIKNKNKINLQLQFIPKDYQEKIITNTINYFNENDKGIIYMPCGTGKTLTGYWIMEKLKAKKVIIAVPSLSLLSQNYKTYIEMNPKLNYMLIGSDVDNLNDELIADKSIFYTTEKQVIKNFLKCRDEFVIFTTYQSSNILAELSKKLNIKYDLTIYDEAHKTVGDVKREFSSLLSDEIKIKKRLFMTATEKVYKYDDDENVLSMDNKKVYGNVIYSYSLKEAIEEGHLCDYKIIVPLINNDILNDLVAKNKYIKFETKLIPSKLYMTAVLMIKAFEDHKDISHMLSFSNFNNDAELLYDIITKFMKNNDFPIKIFKLSGKYSMKNRMKIIEEYKRYNKAIICSARIFNEGINIPIVNSICFTDKKSSTIDIVQCVGRPLRLYENKKMAYIILPVCIENNNMENIFENDELSKIKNVIRTLGTIDNRIIEEFIISDNKNKVKNHFEIERNNIEQFGYEIDYEKFKENLEIYICERNGEFAWMKRYEQVKRFIEENKRYPSKSSKDKYEKSLINWIDDQKKRRRNNNRKLTEEQIKLLDELPNWKWDNNLAENWNNIYIKVKKFIEENKRYPSLNSKDNYEKSLGNWIKTQKCIKRGTFKDRKLTEKQINLLNIIPNWQWNDNKDEKWNEKYIQLKEFIRKYKKYPSKSSKNEFERSLGCWIVKQKCKKRIISKDHKLTIEQITLLTELPNWKWDNNLDENWNEKYNPVKEFIEENK
jgi:predicted helicase